MHGYLILGPEDTTGVMTSEEFVAKLKERWLHVEIYPENDIPGIAVRWDITDDNADLTGHFNRDGLTVGFRGTSKGYATFACWYRSLIPPEIPLIMMDQDYSEVYPLRPETTPDDILSDRIVIRPPPDPEELFTSAR